MSKNAGKQFEIDIKNSETSTIKVIRLEDGNDNKIKPQPSDFIMFDGHIMVYVECKSYQGNSIPMAKLTQIDDMFEDVNGRVNTEGYFLLNFRDHDETRYISVEFVKIIRDMGVKTIHLEALRGYSNRVHQYLKEKDQWHYQLETFFKAVKHDKHYK